MTDEEFEASFDGIVETEDTVTGEDTVDTDLEETENTESEGNALVEEDVETSDEVVEETEDVDTTPELDGAQEETTEEVELSIEELKEFHKTVTGDFKGGGTVVAGITDPKDIISVLQKGVGFDGKAKELATYKRKFNSLSDWSDEDIALIIDAKSGDRDAITKLMQNANVDSLDIDTETESTYVPKAVVTDEKTYKFKEAVNEITKSDHYDKINEVWGLWEDSQEEFSNNPKLFKDLEYEISSGNYAKIAPLVAKERGLGNTDGERMLDTYIRIKLASQSKPTKPKMSETARDKQRDAASIKTNSRQTPKPKVYTDDEYAKMSDEEFGKLFN